MNPKMKKLLWFAGSLLALLAVALALVIAYGGNSRTPVPSSAEADADKHLYQCSMHPNVVSERPGVCPICAMDLQPVKQINAKGITGRAPVDLTAQQQQLINIRVTPVVKAEAAETIRAVGIITYDATRVADVNARVMGWVDQLYADKPGQFIKKGEPLLALYSPDLYSAQKEYLLAWGRVHRKQTPDAQGQSAQLKDYLSANRDSAVSLLESARKRLELWDISTAQIERLEKTRTPENTLELTAPLTGFVLEKKVFPKQMIQAGMMLYRIADLSQVWLDIEVYEYELPLLRVGQTVAVRVDAIPNQTFDGTVDFIYPYLENKTRTTKVRVVLPNPDGQLRPAMYAHAETRVELGRQLLIPAGAMFDTGKRQYVFVKQNEGIFVPREVTLGPKSQDRFVVREGVEEGDLVVIDGNFLLDSESQLKAAASGSTDDAPSGAAHAHAHMSKATPLPAEAGDLFGPLVADYLGIQTALARDSTGGIQDTAARMLTQVESILASDVAPPEEVEEYRQGLTALKEQLRALSATDIEAARTQFGHVSEALVSQLAHFVPPMQEPLAVASCPMWKKSPGRWLQTGKELRNPFMGQKMLTCGETQMVIGEGK
jgi:membrane fusion protein, copper/silver efflux system